MTDSDLFSPQKILSVSELNRSVRETLEGAFPLCWIAGEVSNFTRAASGHWYFSLKDSGAQVRCVMFKGRNSYVNFNVREGDHVEARCNIGFYEPRGEFQLNIDSIRKAGLGLLFEAFEKLKNQLAAEGLFEASAKQSIPPYPQTIGIVTSPDAAALRDVLTTLKRRNPNIGIIIYPTPVQGKGAAELIAKAILTANERAEVDMLIICRGGGSLEDLWSFNEEIVARAMAQCTLPTISGVGHETDLTICDFVADARAATPTAAAELASPHLVDLREQTRYLAKRLHSRMQHLLDQQAQQLDFLAQRLRSPAQQLQAHTERCLQWQHRLQLAMQWQLQQQQQSLALLANSLKQMNPHAILERGYAIVTHKNQVVTTGTALTIGDNINIQLHRGTLDAEITRKND